LWGEQKETDDESPGIRTADVWKVQDREARPAAAGDLRESEAQAEAGL